MKNKMFKKLFLLLTLSAAFTAKSQITNPAPYCGSSFTFNYNMFNDITIGGVTLSFGAKGSPVATTTYKYYNTTVFGDLMKSGNNTITINPYASADAEPIYFALWIDYDHSNTFESSEIVMQNSNTINSGLPVLSQTPSPITKTFTIPAAALTGNTRARLKRTTGTLPYSAAFVPSACAGDFYGCMYDFNINIKDALSTAEADVKNSFRIYPNPAQDFIVIDTAQKVIKARLFSTEGKLVRSYDRTDRLEIASLQNGEYILEAELGNGSSVSQKVIIAK